MYQSLEIPAGVDRAVPETGEVADLLESLVASWDIEVERARATEAEVEAVASFRCDPGHPEVELELEALRHSHRALVRTLERSIADLEALQAKTAGIVRFVAESALASGGSALSLASTGPTEFPVSDETEMIDRTNRRDMANLDVPSRWRPVKRRRALREAARDAS